jgi:LacI family transcriptional regulator
MGNTIKDIAARAGVSTATVSHVINNTRFVSDELRERVVSAIDEIGYHPNEIARGLRRGDTATIGLMIPDNSNPFFAEVAKNIEDIGFEQGYSVILCNSAGDLEREATYIKMLLAKQVDGVIFIACRSKYEHLVDLKKQKDIPVVLVDRDIPLFLGDVVMVDNEQGGYIATKHLLELGHKKIACITGPSDVALSEDRVKGYVRALKEADIKIRQEYVVMGDFGLRSGESGMEKLLSLEDIPSAVFICNDMMAIGALNEARKAGILVPDDISVIGYDDIQLASVVSPALTTIAQPIKELSVAATSMLIKKIQHGAEGEEGKRVVLDAQLVIRNSCSPLVQPEER